MSICVLCEHDLENHKIEKTGVGYEVKCWYEKGQLIDSSFCGCKAGFKDVRVTIIADGGE